MVNKDVYKTVISHTHIVVTTCRLVSH